MIRPLGLGLVAVLSTAGCTLDPTPAPKELPKASTEFSTDEIYPSTSAQDDGTALTVYAALLARGSFLTLGTTDRLVARAGGTELVLASQGQTYEPHYVATFASSPGAMDVMLILDRAGSDDPKVMIHLPPSFELDGPQPTVVKNNVSIDVAILPLPLKDDGTYAAILEGSCVPPGTSGRLNILAGKLNFVFADAVAPGGPDSCPATVKVQHSLPATVDPAFVKPAPVDAIGIRERRFAVTVTR